MKASSFSPFGLWATYRGRSSVRRRGTSNATSRPSKQPEAGHIIEASAASPSSTTIWHSVSRALLWRRSWIDRVYRLIFRVTLAEDTLLQIFDFPKTMTGGDTTGPIRPFVRERVGVFGLPKPEDTSAHSGEGWVEKGVSTPRGFLRPGFQFLKSGRVDFAI